MAENELEGPVLGISWDGTGYGEDGSIWGGEFLLVTAEKMERLGHFRTFRLPGGDTAIREPRRAALGLLYEMLGDEVFERKDFKLLQAFSPAELGTIRTMLARGLNAPMTSSAGRLFDVVASLSGIRQVVRFEGQGAMELEFVLDGQARGTAYEFQIRDGEGPLPWIVDWEPMFRQTLDDVSAGTKADVISAKFHSALAEVIVAAAQRAGQEKVVLSGGCFQNRQLTERAVSRLQGAGFRPYWHQRVPPNDGGIALGQIVAASRMCH